jgi:hypothetical protein
MDPVPPTHSAPGLPAQRAEALLSLRLIRSSRHPKRKYNARCLNWIAHPDVPDKRSYLGVNGPRQPRLQTRETQMALYPGNLKISEVTHRFQARPVAGDREIE